MIYRETKDLIKRVGATLALTASMTIWCGGILYACHKPWEKFEKKQGIEKVVEEKTLTFEEYKNSFKNYKPKFPEIKK